MTMTRSGLVALALGAAVLTTASGCGGSKGLSRDQLIAKADALCRRANTALESAKITPQNLAQVAPGIAAVERQVSTELAKLTPPSSMAADWKVIVDGFRRTGAGLQKVGEVAKATPANAKKPTISRALAEGEQEVSTSQQLRATTAGRNGFEDCSKY